MTNIPDDQAQLFSVYDHVRATAIALAIAFVVWRVCVFIVDRFCQRRFLSRLVPRVATFTTLARSVIGIVVIIAAALVCLNVWAIDVTPAVWSAGIVTASLAFGAQWFIRDVIAGVSVLFEDQFDVGDTVELLTQTNSVVAGRVEAVGLRSTRISDDRGRLVILSNGNIQLVTNASRSQNRVGLTLTLPWKADAGAMRQQLEKCAKEAKVAAGLDAAHVSVTLLDAAPATGTFRVDLVSSDVSLGDAGRRFSELLAVRLQQLGWLQGGEAADAGATASETEKRG